MSVVVKFDRCLNAGEGPDTSTFKDATRACYEGPILTVYKGDKVIAAFRGDTTLGYEIYEITE